MCPCPPGAVWAGDWDGDGEDRGRFFDHAPIRIADTTLTMQGVQSAAGVTSRSILLRLDESIQPNGADFTPAYARRLAAMLQNFADTCEILDEAAR